VISDARAQITATPEGGRDLERPDNGDATVDLSRHGPPQLYAVASNQGGKFPMDQQVVAALALKDQHDTALAGPAAQARLTGDYATLYQTALDQMDAAGPEEKATTAWTSQRAALVEGRTAPS
jgi:hypothetical protein